MKTMWVKAAVLLFVLNHIGEFKQCRCTASPLNARTGDEMMT
uniref:Uncharacterized protein n=1 Tax=Anguilla anguilla TaxID=7936 RepID=A0A0E9RDH0_ANGAN